MFTRVHGVNWGAPTNSAQLLYFFDERMNAGDDPNFVASVVLPNSLDHKKRCVQCILPVTDFKKQ